MPRYGVPMKRSFSDIDGRPADDALQNLDIAYVHPLGQGTRIVARLVLTVEGGSSIRKPDLTSEDVVFLLDKVTQTFLARAGVSTQDVS